MAQAAVQIADFPKVRSGVLPSEVEVLVPLYEATRAAIEAVQGVFNKPRTYGLASSLIEDELDRLYGVETAIREKLLQASSVQSKVWLDLYLEALLSSNFLNGGDANDALAVIAKANALPIVGAKDKH